MGPVPLAAPLETPVYAQNLELLISRVLRCHIRCKAAGKQDDCLIDRLVSHGYRQKISHSHKRLGSCACHSS